LTTFKTNKKLSPGEPGTKKLVKKYGTRLISIRYKTDTETKQTIKTVELIEEIINGKNLKAQPVKIKIDYEEKELRKIIKEKGGVWDKEEKVWVLNYGEVKKLNLIERIIKNYQ